MSTQNDTILDLLDKHTFSVLGIEPSHKVTQLFINHDAHTFVQKLVDGLPYETQDALSNQQCKDEQLAALEGYYAGFFMISKNLGIPDAQTAAKLHMSTLKGINTDTSQYSGYGGEDVLSISDKKQKVLNKQLNAQVQSGTYTNHSNTSMWLFLSTAVNSQKIKAPTQIQYIEEPDPILDSLRRKALELNNMRITGSTLLKNRHHGAFLSALDTSITNYSVDAETGIETNNEKDVLAGAMAAYISVAYAIPLDAAVTRAKIQVNAAGTYQSDQEIHWPILQDMPVSEPRDIFKLTNDNFIWLEDSLLNSFYDAKHNGLSQAYLAGMNTLNLYLLSEYTKQNKSVFSALQQVNGVLQDLLNENYAFNASGIWRNLLQKSFSDTCDNYDVITPHQVAIGYACAHMTFQTSMSPANIKKLVTTRPDLFLQACTQKSNGTNLLSPQQIAKPTHPDDIMNALDSIRDASKYQDFGLVNASFKTGFQAYQHFISCLYTR